MAQCSNNNGFLVPVVALASWLVPGSGYLLIGQRVRAVTVFVSIVIVFVLGLLIGGVKVVDPPTFGEMGLWAALMQKPWFIGQFLAGPMALVTAMISSWPRFLTSHSQLNEIGTLYTAVAGMLNLLVVIDASYRCARGETAGDER